MPPGKPTHQLSPSPLIKSKITTLLSLLSAPLCALMLLLPLSAMASETAPATALVAKSQTSRLDTLTYANYDQVRVKDLALELNLDFNLKRLCGEAVLSLEWLTKTDKLILDTRSLQIEAVSGLDNQGQWHSLPFSLGASHEVMGQALTIDTGKLSQAPAKVKVAYHTVPEASGLQWLTPAQTQGKTQPFMFSQSQAIHARSWIPLQDTPAVRLTYSARIGAPKGIEVLMSADRQAPSEVSASKTEASQTVTRFSMRQPIPAYLIAIAAGDLAFAPLDETSGIWAEPATLASALAEFADTPQMITQAEKRYGSYRWGRYDLLILPPSFPFGGMENPRLSFITPTVIAGDKSLVSMIAHELAHSWSGNLVTNASWPDLWLNEGFTTYVENRIMEDLYGKERALMEQTIAYGELREELAELDAADTRLHLSLQGRDPDDAFSSVPYTKGQMFLVFLEKRFGRARFDAFVRGYFDHFAFKSLDTQTFRDYLSTQLLQAYPGIVTQAEVDEWIFAPGLPAFAHEPHTDAFDAVDTQRSAWLAGKLSTAALQTEDWSVHQWLHFLNRLPRENSPGYHGKLAELNHRFALDGSGNSEIAFSWFSLTLDCEDYSHRAALGAFLGRIGRMRLIVPLYRKLSQSSEADWARGIFDRARAGYHPITVFSIAPLFSG
jgi:leukotriene-A4 hydrolase